MLFGKNIMKITKSYLKILIKEEIKKSNIDKVRDQLEELVNKDQNLNEDPPARIPLQKKVILPFIQKNIDTIFSDKENIDKWGNCISKAFLLVQHMDNFVNNQKKFLEVMRQKAPNHPGYQFLEDRCKVNEWILKNYNNEKYYYNGKPLPQPTVNVRNKKYFSDVGGNYPSSEVALQKAREAGNVLLVDAVEATGAKTQPSYNVKIF